MGQMLCVKRYLFANLVTNIELNHIMQYIYKCVFDNHHCVCIEKKKGEYKQTPVSHRLVLGPYKIQKEVKSTQKQPSCEKIVWP